MHMDMVIQLLVPGMEHLDDAGQSAKTPGIGGKFQECFGTAAVEEAIKKLLVTVEERV